LDASDPIRLRQYHLTNIVRAIFDAGTNFIRLIVLGSRLYSETTTKCQLNFNKSNTYLLHGAESFLRRNGVCS